MCPFCCSSFGEGNIGSSESDSNIESGKGAQLLRKFSTVGCCSFGGGRGGSEEGLKGRASSA